MTRGNLWRWGGGGDIRGPSGPGWDGGRGDIKGPWGWVGDTRRPQGQAGGHKGTLEGGREGERQKGTPGGGEGVVT